VRAAIADVSPGLFPGAFCKAVPDILAGSSEHCLVMHSDGAGTKSALAWLHYLRHGEERVFSDIAQDSLVMNLDDLICVGASGPFLLSNTIGRNSKLVTGAIVKAIIMGYEGLAQRLSPYGVDIVTCGGETADVGDIVRTVIVDSTITTRMLRSGFINCHMVAPGHEIVGLASFGKAAYEDKPNSGIGTNGFTALRHGVLSASYKYTAPETYAPEIAGLAYQGRFDIDDPLPGEACTVGEAFLSPTRTYAPVVIELLRQVRSGISAMFHNSGGGQTKCLGFGEGVRYEKDNMFQIPPVFRFIQETTGAALREMLTTFNMGHLLEVVCDPAASAEIIAITKGFGIDARVVGRVERKAEGRSLVVTMDDETLEFDADAIGSP